MVSPTRIACEYGPIAAGACLEWICCLLTMPPVAADFSTHSARSSCHLQAGGHPRIDAAVERAHTLEAELAQAFCHFHRTRLVRTRAIHDDLFVRDEIVDAAHRLDID